MEAEAKGHFEILDKKAKGLGALVEVNRMRARRAFFVLLWLQSWRTLIFSWSLSTRVVVEPMLLSVC